MSMHVRGTVAHAPMSVGLSAQSPVSATDPGPTSPAQPEADWHVPFTPLLVPTPAELLRQGPSLWDMHPRNPEGIGRPGHHADSNLPQNASTSPASGAEDAGAPHASEDAGESAERSGAAKTAMTAGIAGGLAQNAIDVTRLVKKYPEALRAGRFDPALGPLGRLPTALGLTALTRPDSRVIDPRAPRVATAASIGKSFSRWDEIAMKSSVLLGTSLAGVQILSSIPNLADALGKDGPWQENLAMSTSGRAGVLQLGGGVLGASLFYTALRQTKASSTAVGNVSRILEAGKAPIMARPLFGRIGTATALVVMANELGYLDSLNKGESRSIGAVLGDAGRGTPVVNDPALRTAAILGAAGIVGFKGHRAFMAAGGLTRAVSALPNGLAGISKGHVIGGAVVTALLGAQLLGGLSSLDSKD